MTTHAQEADENQGRASTFKEDFTDLLKNAHEDLDQIERSLRTQGLDLILAEPPAKGDPAPADDADKGPESAQLIAIAHLAALKDRIDKERDRVDKERQERANRASRKSDSEEELSSKKVSSHPESPPRPEFNSAAAGPTRTNATSEKADDVSDATLPGQDQAAANKPMDVPPEAASNARSLRDPTTSALREASGAIETLLAHLTARRDFTFLNVVLSHRAEVVAVGAGIVTLAALVLGTFHLFGKVVAAHPPALPHMIEHALRATPADLSWAMPLYLALGAIALAPLVIAWLRYEDRAQAEASIRNVRTQLESLNGQLRDSRGSSAPRVGVAIQRGFSKLRSLGAAIWASIRQTFSGNVDAASESSAGERTPSPVLQNETASPSSFKFPRGIPIRTLVVATLVGLAVAVVFRMLEVASETSLGYKWLIQVVCLLAILAGAALAGRLAALGIQRFLGQFNALRPLAPRAARSARWAVRLAACVALLAGYGAGFPRDLATIQTGRACTLYSEVAPFEMGDGRLRLLGSNGAMTVLNREDIAEIRVGEACPESPGLAQIDPTPDSSAIAILAKALETLAGGFGQGFDVRIASEGLRIEHVGTPTLSVEPKGSIQLAVSVPERFEFAMPEAVRFAMPDPIRFDPADLSPSADDEQSYALLAAALLQHCMSAAQYRTGWVAGKETRRGIYDETCNDLFKRVRSRVHEARNERPHGTKGESVASAE